MKKYLFLLLALLCFKLKGQVDSFKIDTTTFSCAGIIDWDLFISKDSLCSNVESNLLYRNPIVNKNAYAFVGISIQQIDEREIWFAFKNKKNIKLDLNERTYNGFTFFFTRSEELNRSNHNTHEFLCYRYAINNKLQLVIYLESLSGLIEVPELEANLDSLIFDFTSRNGDVLRKLNPIFSLKFSSPDSSWYDFAFLKFDRPIGWNITRVPKDTNDYIDHRIIQLSCPIPFASIYIKVEHFSELFPPKLLDQSFESKKSSIISPIMNNDSNLAIPFYKSPAILNQGFFIVRHFYTSILAGNPDSRIRTANSFTIGIIRNSKIALYINICLDSNFPNLAQANFYDQLLLQYVLHLEALNNFSTWSK